MTDTLFSALDTPASTHHTSGYRLKRVEVLNWGTFDKRVYTLTPGGATSLLTGDIGSGKSTLVDAITTLLLPAHRIAYNKAAGADARERTLRSYVEGHYKSERNETTGASRPVGLRDDRSYTVILGMFENVGHAETVTLAQVFHQKDRAGQPDRFYVTATRPLAIDSDFADFGNELTALRARLRGSGATIDTSYPDYQRRVRRLLGIASEQAMELFHQTVSMKSVGNLNDFVRQHMLEPVEADTRVRAIISHYTDLVKAHEAVRTATDQLAILTPLIDAADRYDDTRTTHTAHRNERDAVAPYIAERVRAILATELEKCETRKRVLTEESDALARERAALAPTRDTLTVHRAQAGGDRLREIDAEIRRAEDDMSARADRRRRYTELSETAQLAPVDSAYEFQARRDDIAHRAAELAHEDQAEALRRDPLMERRIDVRRARDTIEREITSLRTRRNSIPIDLERVRTELCAALGVEPHELPYAAELIDISPDGGEWRGAAERVLRGFALTMLVPHHHYAAVTHWVNEHRLNARLVYRRVPERQVRSTPATLHGRRLTNILTVEAGPFAEYLSIELAQRADHVLADTVGELRREHRAITREGLTKDGDRHEKDDRDDILSPRGWVLGRDNGRKIAMLEAEHTTLITEYERLTSELDAADEAARARRTISAALAGLDEYRTWSDIDTESAAAQLSRLTEEQHQLVAGSDELRNLDTRIAQIDAEENRLTERLTAVATAIGGIEQLIRDMRERDQREEQTLQAIGAEVIEIARSHYAALTSRHGQTPLSTVADYDALRVGLTGELTVAIDRLQREMNGYTTNIQQQMAEFLRRWPTYRAELDADIDSLAAFRELHTTVLRDDLPRFEAEFRHQLTTNAIRELAQFSTWLRRQADDIRQRIDRINDALRAIDYTEGRIIQLVAEPTVNHDVRQFRADLREATSDALGSAERSDLLESRFEQIRQLIERFGGREGHADADKAWLKRVTDVRNWYTFAASEQDRVTGDEYEHYTDSDGKSGGQKEKLAYTILAASLAYQFGLEWGVEKSRDFRFAVIDEAFGRGSDVSTRYALELFAKLGLQLLIVTPLQKVHIIEPYVRTIGFVDNPTGAASRVHTMTIEEFRERRREIS